MLTRVNSLLLAPHVALVEAGVPVDSVLRPDVLDRTGVRAALAYLRLGAHPEGFSGDDLVEVYRRPTRGFPQWIPKWLRGRLDIADLRAIADRLDDAKVATKVLALADDLQLVTDAVQSGTTREALAVVRDRIGLGGAMGLLDASKAAEGGSSQLDDLDALTQVADLHPDPRTFEAWLRTVFHRETTPGASRSRPSTGSRAWSGTGSPSSASPPGSCPTGWPRTWRRSAGCCTSPSPAAATRPSCWPTPPARRRSSTS